MDSAFMHAATDGKVGYYQPVPTDGGVLDGEEWSEPPGANALQHFQTEPDFRAAARHPRSGMLRKKKHHMLSKVLTKANVFPGNSKSFRERLVAFPRRLLDCTRDALDEFLQCLHMFGEMAISHLFELFFTVISYVSCVCLGVVHYQIVDPSFFKATGLLLAVLLSLRAKMAMSRRQKLMSGILSMMNSAKNIMELVGNEIPEKRRRLRYMLHFCFNEIGTWVMHAEESTDCISLDSLPEEDRDIAFVLRGKYKLHTSPRALLVYLRQFCDELFDPDFEKFRCSTNTSGLMETQAQVEPVYFSEEVANTPPLNTEGTASSRAFSPADAAALSRQGTLDASARSRQGSFTLDASATGGGEATSSTAFLSQPAATATEQPPPVQVASGDVGFKVDRISCIRRWHRNCDTELQNITVQFDTLQMYKEELHTAQFRWMLSSVILLYVALYPWCVRHESTVVLGGTTIGMAFVFYGLNAMTEQLEDPVAQHQQGFDLTAIFEAMFDKMDKDEAVRTQCIQFLRRKKAMGEAVTEELHDQFEERLLARGQLDASEADSVSVATFGQRRRSYTAG